MPIIDIEVVTAVGTDSSTALPSALADALGAVFGSPPGHTWVRLRYLPRTAYAENGTRLADHELPVFVIVLHAHPPQADALIQEVGAVTAAVAACVGVPLSRVHVQYAPAAAGRQAFGGKLVQ